MLINKKEFRVIPGYPSYWVSADGDIYSSKSKKLLKQTVSDVFKYYKVILWQNGKSKNLPVHKLVALAWVELPVGYDYSDVLNNYKSRELIVDHIDGNKLNDVQENLEWVTISQNTQRAYDNGLVHDRGGWKSTPYSKRYGNTESCNN